MKDEFSDLDFYFMRQALKEARRGYGRTSPNPCVGAIIVKENEIIARGYHQKAGGPHAEVEALNKAGAAAQGAEMYVTLEPCNHTGRTPPCSRAVAAAGIVRVCIGMLDPNPLVDGGGADYLRAAGVTVRYGLLEEQCRVLNRPFIRFSETGRPWVLLKAGLTLDGKISFRKGHQDIITGPESLRQVHKLRDCSDAILVGINTVTIDNPSLTSRVQGRRTKNPIRVILDTNLSISLDSRVVLDNQDRLTWICCGDHVNQEKVSKLADHGVTTIPIRVDKDGKLNLEHLLDELGGRQITSLLVEGGATVHGAFLRAKLADHLQFFYAPVFGGSSGTPVITDYPVSGGKEEAVQLKNPRYRRFGPDLMVSGDLEYSDNQSMGSPSSEDLF
jgi:diaminohydroxyphosphoribosylaminopyrimidine deaminase/5-amino-6-(5-phosphoribosylamino)uracil reductase